MSAAVGSFFSRSVVRPGGVSKSAALASTIRRDSSSVIVLPAPFGMPLSTVSANSKALSAISSVTTRLDEGGRVGPLLAGDERRLVDDRATRDERDLVRPEGALADPPVAGEHGLQIVDEIRAGERPVADVACGLTAHGLERKLGRLEQLEEAGDGEP